MKDGTSEEDFTAMRRKRDATLDMPALIYPAVQFNIRGGRPPPAEPNGRSYLKLPLRARNHEMSTTTDRGVSKVPEVTLLFWVIKIAATTLGETGGDAVSMSMNLGYLVGTAIFAVIFIAVVAAQIAAKRFHPSLYWTTIIATTTVGTTLADFADRSLGIGYAGGAALLLALLCASLFALASHARHRLDRHGELAEGRDVLLGHDHVLADARHGARRLDRRLRGPRLPRQRGRVRRAARA